VFHCFSGTADEAQKAIDMGYLLGIGGVVTFKKSALADIVREVPLDKIVLETDSPYLAPTPFRGKRNESSYIPYICARVAELTNCSVEDLAAITTRNAERIFGLK
jgi:TatD DNase family protein